jgi:hypothetical protein
MIELVCGNCGTAFRAYPSRIAIGQGRYCSRLCARRAAAQARQRHWKDSFTDLLWLPEPNSGCWLWLGGVNRLGYGVVPKRAKSKGTTAHRAAYLMAHGSIPEGMDILHRCDVRCCVNPDHLFAGTHHDNMRDMMAKGRGRQLRGEKHHAVKVTPTIVRAIRASTEPHKVLAERYGISRHTVHTIRDFRTWKHIEGKTMPAPHRGGLSPTANAARRSG